MVELNAKQNQNYQKKEPSNDNPIEKKIPLLFLLVLIISIVGYFSSYIHWVEYTFAHIGGLSIVGLAGCCAGVIAKKKGYGYWKAFLIAFFLPIILGFIAGFLFQPIACGGSVSLAVAVLIVIIYSLVIPREVKKLI